MTQTGTIVYFDSGKGFGFIEPDGSAEFDRSGERRDHNIFVHSSELRRSGIRNVELGDRVVFDRVPGKRKSELMAGNIRLAA